MRCPRCELEERRLSNSVLFAFPGVSLSQLDFLLVKEFGIQNLMVTTKLWSTANTMSEIGRLLGAFNEMWAQRPSAFDRAELE